MSELSILNVGAGDVKISFDKSNPAERIRACRIVKDMLRRGYALLVEVERDGKKAFERAVDFDENTAEYIVTDFDPMQAREADMEEGADRLRAEQERGNGEGSENEEIGSPIPNGEGGEVPKQAGKRGRPRGSGKRVAAESTRAVGVARSAGG